MNEKKLTPIQQAIADSIVLDDLQKYNMETAYKYLQKAVDSVEQGGRARAQEHLREAQMWRVKTPPYYQDKEFDELYNTTYNQAYRGYA